MERSRDGCNERWRRKRMFVAWIFVNVRCACAQFLLWSIRAMEFLREKICKQILFAYNEMLKRMQTAIYMDTAKSICWYPILLLLIILIHKILRLSSLFLSPLATKVNLSCNHSFKVSETIVSFYEPFNRHFVEHSRHTRRCRCAFYAFRWNSSEKCKRWFLIKKWWINWTNGRWANERICCLML